MLPLASVVRPVWNNLAAEPVDLVLLPLAFIQEPETVELRSITVSAAFLISASFKFCTVRLNDSFSFVCRDSIPTNFIGVEIESWQILPHFDASLVILDAVFVP